MIGSLIGIIASSGGAAAGGDYESIATVTVGSGGSSSISFTSIPSTYQHLQVRGIARGTAAYTYSNLFFQFNLDTGSNYSYHYIYGNGSAAGVAAGTTQSSILGARITDGSATASVFGACVFDVLDYKSTNKYKTLRHLGGVDNNGGGEIYLSSGLWMNTAAVSSIQIVSGNGNLAQYSSFALYGIKG